MLVENFVILQGKIYRVVIKFEVIEKFIEKIFEKLYLKRKKNLIIRNQSEFYWRKKFIKSLIHKTFDYITIKRKAQWRLKRKVLITPRANRHRPRCLRNSEDRFSGPRQDHPKKSWLTFVDFYRIDCLAQSQFHQCRIQVFQVPIQTKSLIYIFNFVILISDSRQYFSAFANFHFLQFLN